MTGCGVKTKGSADLFVLRLSLTRFKNWCVETGATGMSYALSSVLLPPATAVTHPGQPATPRTAAWPFALISSQRSVVSSMKTWPVFLLRMVFTEGMFSANHFCSCCMNL